MKRTTRKMGLIAFAIVVGISTLCTSCHKDSKTTTQTGTTAFTYHVKMGTQANTSIPRCLCLTTGQLYDWTSATANSTLIDMISDIYSNEVDIEAPLKINQTTAWVRRKGTLFSGSITGMDLTSFNNIQTSGQVAAYCTSHSPSGNYYWESGIGKVFTIQTYENKQAIVRVSNIQGSDSDTQGFIELDVKVAL